MIQLRRRPGIAQKDFGLLRIKVFLPRNLHGHGALQLRIAGLPHAAVTASPYLLHKLEVPQHLHAGPVRVRGIAPGQAKTAATGRAEHVGPGSLFDRIERHVAMRTADLHVVTLAERKRRGELNPVIIRSTTGNVNLQHVAKRLPLRHSFGPKAVSMSHQPNRFSIVPKNDRVYETEIACRKLKRLMTRAGWSG